MLNLDGVGDHDLANKAAFLTGLFRDEGFADHLTGDLTDFSGILGKMNSALEAIFKGALTPTTSVDLGFHDQKVGANFFCDGFRLFSCFCHLSPGTGDVKAIEQLLCLIFVDIHAGNRWAR